MAKAKARYWGGIQFGDVESQGINFDWEAA